MKLLVGALCIANVAMSSLAPFLHTFVSIPAIRETFTSESTAKWLADEIHGKDLQSIKSEIAASREKLRLLEDNLTTPESERETAFLRNKIDFLGKNAMLLYCQGICEYIKAVRSDYHPRPLDAPPFLTYSAGQSSSEDDASSNSDSDSGSDRTQSEVWTELLSTLSHAEPFEQLVAVVASGMHVVDREDMSGHDLNDYTIFGYIQNSNLYIPTGSAYTLIPENETETRQVDTFDAAMDGAPIADATILIANTVHDTLYTHSSMYTNEKKKIATLRVLQKVREVFQKQLLQENVV